MAKKIKIFAVAKLQAVLIGLLGLLAGILYSFGGLVIDTLVTVGVMTSAETSGLSYGTILAFGALFVMPIIGIIVGYIIGLVSAILYNTTAKWLGDIDLDIKK